MANVPTPRSYSQILSDILSSFLSRLALKRIRPGSPLLTVMMSAAQSDLRTVKDIFDALAARDLDQATGSQLDQIGRDEEIPRLSSSPASGAVVVGDSRFPRISTIIFPGGVAPIAGSGTVQVSDASTFPLAGSIHIGRGTLNYEGPLAYTRSGSTSPWILTITANTHKFHNLNESVILAQGGDRTIAAGTAVRTPQGHSGSPVVFSSLYAATLLDGEVSISGIRVVAQVPGQNGNVPAGTVTDFSSAPFTGATVTNPLPFSNGQPTENDDDYRERIRACRRSKSKGTDLAIQVAVKGITAADENTRATSVSVVHRQGYPTTVYIDDGSGYEERSRGVVGENFVTGAFGGEQYFDTSHRPIAKAFVTSTILAPFVLAEAVALAVEVGGVISEHAFHRPEFRAIGNADAYEVVASINSDPLCLFGARTADAGTKVVLFAKSEKNEDVRVVVPAVDVDANPAFLFPAARVDTMRLYRNDRLLSKDGLQAELVSNPPANWGTFTASETLIVDVDGTKPLTYTITDQDFIDAKTGFATVARNSLAAWVKVLNARLPGVTVREAFGCLVVVSNLGATGRAKLQITGGSLVTKKVFPLALSVGRDCDYTLDRNTGQFCLATPLELGDTLSAGSSNSRSFLESAKLTSINLLSTANLWVSVDAGAREVVTGLNASTSLSIAVQKIEPWGMRVRVTSTTSVFSNVAVGDWVMIWDATVNASMKGLFRVSDVDATAGLWFEVDHSIMTSSRSYAASIVLPDGTILLTGGVSASITITPTAEIFSPATHTFTATGSMTYARYGHRLFWASSTKVVAMGGVDGYGNPVLPVEFYDLTTGTWTVGSSIPYVATGYHMGQFTWVANGPIIVCGGMDATSTSLTTAYLYNPVADMWAVTGSMDYARVKAGCCIFSDSKFLMVGGIAGSALNTGEYYDTADHIWHDVSNTLTNPAVSPQAVEMSAGTVMVAGGLVSNVATKACYIYSAGGNAFAPTGNLNQYHNYGTLVKVGTTAVFAHGLTDSHAEVYTSPTWTLSAVASPITGLRLALTASTVTISGKAYAFFFGGGIVGSGAVSAVADVYNVTDDAWAQTKVDAGVTQAAFTLSSLGMSFTRAAGQVQNLQLVAANNHTPTSLASLLKADGATSSTYHTNYVSLRTNTLSDAGDIALVGADLEGAKLSIPIGDAVSNTGSHLAYAESGSSDLGTLAFKILTVLGHDSTDGVLFLSEDLVDPQNQIMGLTAYDDLASAVPATALTRAGNNSYMRSGIALVDSDRSNYKGRYLHLRESPVREWVVGDRFVSMSPYAIGPNDTLTVVIDQDVDSKRYTIPMGRSLKPVGTTYGNTCAFKDHDNSDRSLAAAFGVGFDFNDFAVYMSSRTISDSTGTPAGSILWRYQILGPDGDSARVSYGYSDSPNQAVSISTDPTTADKVSIRILLPTGAAKTGGQITATARVGLIYAVNGYRNLIGYILGYSVAATRRVRINYINRNTTAFTGTVSNGGGAWGTVVVDSDSLPGGLTGNGHIDVQTITGTFLSGDPITTSGGSAATIAAVPFGITTLTPVISGIGATVGASIADHGLQAGNILFLHSTNGSFASGQITVLERTATTITYSEASTLEATSSNIGTISFDPTQAISLPNSPVIGATDLFHIGATSFTHPLMQNQTIQIAESGLQYVLGYSGDYFSGAPVTVPSWELLGDADAISLYPINASAATAAQVVAAVNALPHTPIKGTLLGTGADAIVHSSDDLAGAGDQWDNLSDGINYVYQTICPANPTLDYSLTFKTDVAASLAPTCDWTNEKVVLVPRTAEACARWMGTLTVSGLSTAAEISVCEQASKLQIVSNVAGTGGAVQVQTGTANSALAAVVGSASLVSTDWALVTVPTADTQGLFAGCWVSVDNASDSYKAIFDSATVLNSISSSGFVNTNTVAYVEPVSPILSESWKVEKQGRFVYFSMTKAMLNALPSLSAVSEGDWVRVLPPTTVDTSLTQIAGSNQGQYRVVRVVSGYDSIGFWIENVNVIEQTAQCDVHFVQANSIMPGDQISINTSLWGVGNRVTWIVETIGQTTLGGAEFVSAYTFKLSTASRVPQAHGSAVALGTQAGLVQVVDRAPARLIKRIQSISLNPTDSSYSDIKFTTGACYDLISTDLGSVITALDKFNFPTDIKQGVNGYSYNVGLIGEANRVLYGDPRNSSKYPGVVASSADLNTSGAPVKRIIVSLSVRTRNGIQGDIRERVQSVVASVINSAAIGQPISIGKIIAAAERVPNVMAVAVIAPIYSATQDMISVQPMEKPMVLDLEHDINVSFTGN